MYTPIRTGSVLIASLPADDSQYDTALVNLFVFFQLFGLFGAIMTCGSAFFSTVRRHRTWYSFIASWIISTFSYSLLFFGGQLFTDKPSLGLCAAQAALVYAAPPVAATATLGLVTQIWFNIHVALTRGKPFQRQELWGWVILIAPYIVWVAIVIESLAFGLSQPESIRRTGSGMYCNTGIPIPGRVSAGFVSLVLFIAVGIEITIIVSLRNNWAMLKATKQTRSLVIRVFIFTLFGVFAIGMGLFFTFSVHHGAQLNVVISTLPVVAILIFGSQKDLLETWMFWKWRRRAVTPDDASDSGLVMKGSARPPLNP